MRQKFLRHTDAGILHFYLILSPSRAAYLSYGYRYASPLRSKFERIRQKIIQDLADAEGIPQDLRIR